MYATIGSHRLRYLVPFKHYSSISASSSYVTLINHLKKNEISTTPMWKSSSATLKAEQDVYSYVLDSLSDSKIKYSENSICSIWKYNNNNGRYLRYVNTAQETNIVIDFVINKTELFLFKNHIGFICYEIVLLSQGIALDDFFIFQNNIKEYSYKNKGIRILSPESKHSISRDKIFDTSKNMMKPVKLINQHNKVKWIECADLSFAYGNDNLSSLKEIIINQKTKDEKKDYITIYREYNIGTWIASLIQELNDVDDNLFIDYFTKRQYSATVPIPDKAILYAFLSKEYSEDSRKNNYDEAFYLANGYASTYDIPDNLETNCFVPFQGTTWYASRQGCGCIVTSSSRELNFHKSVFKAKVVNDYFFLFLILINQMYALTYYSELISQELSSNIDDYMRANEEIKSKLLEVLTDINVFLMKCVHTSVSSLQHQNEYYEYIKRQLDIDGGVKSLKIGIDGLSSLQDSLIQQSNERREKREEEVRIRSDRLLTLSLACLALLTVISAVSDAKTLLWDSDPIAAFHYVTIHPIFLFTLILIMLIATMVVISIILILHEMVKNTKKD